MPIWTIALLLIGLALPLPAMADFSVNPKPLSTAGLSLKYRQIHDSRFRRIVAFRFRDCVGVDTVQSEYATPAGIVVITQRHNVGTSGDTRLAQVSSVARHVSLSQRVALRSRKGTPYAVALMSNAAMRTNRYVIEIDFSDSVVTTAVSSDIPVSVITSVIDEIY